MSANPISRLGTQSWRMPDRKKTGIGRSPRSGAPHPIELSANWRRCDQFRLLEPQIDAQRVHVWPFEANLPIEIHILDGDGARTVSKNRHEYFEIFFVCSGSIDFVVEDRRLPMEQGDMAIVGSALHHSIQCLPNTRSRIGALYFDPNFICGDGTACSAEYLAPFLDQDAGFPHVVPAATRLPGRIIELMEMIQEEMPGTSRRSRLAISTYLKTILILLVSQYAHHTRGVDSLRQKQRAQQRLEKFFEFLPGHLEDIIHVQDAAHMCNLSKAEFASCLRRLTGRSFRDYLNHYRVARAQIVLAETNHPIAQIAQDAGFCDQSYFGAVFHKFTGMTPLAFRRHQSKDGGRSRQSAPYCASIVEAPDADFRRRC